MVTSLGGCEGQKLYLCCTEIPSGLYLTYLFSVGLETALTAELRGNLPGILDLNLEHYDSGGAGRPSSTLPNLPADLIVVA